MTIVLSVVPNIQNVSVLISRSLRILVIFLSGLQCVIWRNRPYLRFDFGPIKFWHNYVIFILILHSLSPFFIFPPFYKYVCLIATQRRNKSELILVLAAQKSKYTSKKPELTRSMQSVLTRWREWPTSLVSSDHLEDGRMQNSHKSSSKIPFFYLTKCN